MPPVGNQGQQSSCVAWAVAYSTKSYQEYIERKDKINWNYKEGNSLNYKTLFSPSFIYNQINKGRDNGSIIEDALQLVIAKGSITLDEMPYDQKDFKTQPTKSIIEKASKFRAKEFLRIKPTQTNEIKHQITMGRPVITGIPVSQGFYNLKKNEVYKEPKGNNLGGHAIVIVGYDDSLDAFKIQNSWGTAWADKGFGFIGYKFFSKYGYNGFVLIDEIDPNVKPNESNIPPNIHDDSNSISEEIKAPTEIFATNGNYSNKIIISWTAVKNAIGYEIYRSIADDDNFQQIGLSQSTQFEDTAIEPNQTYSYKITSVSEDDVSELSDTIASGFAKSDKMSPTPEKVLNLVASLGEFPDKIILKWTALKNVTGYSIYKLDSNSKIFKLIGKSNDAIYEDKTAQKNGNPETYIVSGIYKSSTGQLSDSVIGKTSLLDKPSTPQGVIASMGQFKDKVVLKWNKVNGAISYLVYKFHNDKWSTISETSDEEIIDNNVQKGINYYTVIAKNKNNQWSNFSKYVIGYIDANLKRGGSKLEPPTGLLVSIDPETSSATLSWNEVKNADEYNVWEKKQGESKWKFKQKVLADKKYYTFQIPEKEKFFLYSITSKKLLDSDSEKSNIVSVVLSTPKRTAKTRGFGSISKLEKFKGTWSAIQWDENIGTKNVVMEISNEAGNEVLIKFDNKKVLKGTYIPGSPTLDIDGKVKIKLSGYGDTLSVELNDKSILNEKTELSFLKE